MMKKGIRYPFSFCCFFGMTDRSSLPPDITRCPLVLLSSPRHRLITVQSMIVCIFNMFFLYFLFNLFFFLGLLIFRLEYILSRFPHPIYSPPVVLTNPPAS